MNTLNQRDPKWGNIKLGNSDTYIKDYGCTITCIAMIVGTTPNIVNDRLKAVGGFSGNLVIWAKIADAFPGITVKRIWSYDNGDVSANVPNVLVEVPAYPIGGSGRHWVVYIGNQQCNDPWTGLVRPTSDFPNPSGYCVLTGKWKDSEVIAQPIAQTPAILVFTDQTVIPGNLLRGEDKEIQQLRGIMIDAERLEKELKDCDYHLVKDGVMPSTPPTQPLQPIQSIQPINPFDQFLQWLASKFK